MDLVSEPYERQRYLVKRCVSIRFFPHGQFGDSLMVWLLCAMQENEALVLYSPVRLLNSRRVFMKLQRWRIILQQNSVSLQRILDITNQSARMAKVYSNISGYNNNLEYNGRAPERIFLSEA